MEYRNGSDLLLAKLGGQYFLIAMKLEIDVWHHLLDVFTKFQINISNHME